MKKHDKIMVEQYRKLLKKQKGKGSYETGVRLAASNAAASTRQHARELKKWGGKRESIEWLKATADELDKLADL